MKLEEALTIANEVKALLLSNCERLEIAGSIRRRRPEVNDIDLVFIPRNREGIINSCLEMGRVVLCGPKIARVELTSNIWNLAVGMDMFPLDLYFATQENFATLLLIRTGSKNSNIRLCQLAQRRGWHLAANGDGLFDENKKRVAGDTEESIFTALGLLYQEPWQRT